jgi:uncharacterized protein (DUF433 family)
MRITVSDVLDALASSRTIHQLLADFQGLTEEEVRACLRRAVATGLGSARGNQTEMAR